MDLSWEQTVSVFWYLKGNPLDSVENSDSDASPQETSSGEATGTQLDGWQQNLAKLAAVYYQLSPKKNNETMFWIYFLGKLAGREKTCLRIINYVIVSFSLEISGQILPA